MCTAELHKRRNQFFLSVPHPPKKPSNLSSPFSKYLNLILQISQIFVTKYIMKNVSFVIQKYTHVCQLKTQCSLHPKKSHSFLQFYEIQAYETVDTETLLPLEVITSNSNTSDQLYSINIHLTILFFVS